MPTSRAVFVALALSSCCAFAALAAPVTLNLRPGLWEMSTAGETTGAPPIPAELLARVPPERRAKFEAAMAASQARASAPHTVKRCITAENLRRGIDVDDKLNNGRCRPTVVSSTPSTMDMRMQCAGPKETVSGTFHFEAVSPDAVTGSINMTISGSGNAMTMKRTIQGKWLSADCGSVKSSDN